jgi:hypothetical protein
MDDNRAIDDLTYNVASSDLGSLYQIDLETPPRWSTDGQWIAFLGRSMDEKRPTIELFVTDVESSTVTRLTQGGNVVIASYWLDAATLLYGQRDGDRSVAFFRISVSSLPATPTPLGLIESKP